ncbi:MAG: DNA polymerase III subunit alpha [Anaerolineae bacterium]|nr:DNA polymerase III subunit alpha [Anaerolineae bacterium]
MIAHLSTHSYFSLLEGVPSPAELVREAARTGMTALALTDHGLLTGVVLFYRACQSAGIQPLIGLEVDLAWGQERRRVSLLSAGERGWSNLCKISSRLQLSGRPAFTSFEELEPFANDLLCLSSDLGDMSGRRISALRGLFGDRLYLALPGPIYDLVVLGRKLSISCVAAPPVFFLQRSQAGQQRLLSAIRCGTTLSSLPAGESAPENAVFLSPGEMTSLFRPYPEAIGNIDEVVQRCHSSLPVGSAHYPRVPIPDGLTPAEYLRKRAEDGARLLYRRMTPEIQSRLDHELGVISNLGFEPVFLIVDELLQFARRENIPTASRGSASSSLVAHCLGITTPDPITLDLYFERFLNPARTTPPDIDTDICSVGREKVIRHVFETYGEERVAMVATINRFRPRSALGDVAKAHGMTPDAVRQLTAQLPYAFWARREDNAAEGEAQEGSPFKDLRAKRPDLKKILGDAETVLRFPRHLSQHPGGLVVTPGEVTERVPVTHSGTGGIIITQLDLEDVEALGLIKIDLLGIRGLTVLGDVSRAIQSWRMKEYPTALSVLDAIPEEDEPTSQRVLNGETIGCFQIESPGMRATLKEIQARTSADIMVALALYRPGPLQGGLKDAFVKRFRGEEEVSQLHPALTPILRSTYGVILYQEQVLQIAKQLAGFSLAEGDLLRRAMSHFDPGKQMQVLKEKFVRAVMENSGMTPDVGERVWELMAAFAGYGFPKAHAASYAMVGWRSAWCKTHFPAEFMAAVLANWGGYYSQRVYLTEARRLGLKVKPPHVNHSKRQFSVTYPGGEPMLYMGLDQVKDLTVRTQNQILSRRPFHSLDDFLEKVDPRPKEADNLIQVGALDGLGHIPAMLRRIAGGGWIAGQMSLFELTEKDEEDWGIEARVKAQEERLGLGVDAHPLELVANQITARGALSTLAAAQRIGQRVKVAGIRLASHRSQTSRGETMMFLTLEDLEGMLDVIFFPDVYRRHVDQGLLCRREGQKVFDDAA